ncbi:hypothetical protein SAMN04515647_4751 [Cohaesibacter sp. ES.047]|uniref:tetratricopeptide repeat protein n=1 Tax=Cohaesibacter sp. ES.047 TaxID=1798205 RepID=UPI000BB67C20|nr:hypothetical protein [Cohaesibacter sp. ES.047]SNY91716.1 hypothetical protein SAMN04515647_1950 [Cohaesibacter sp. ES.047]SNY94425.1 hypothetical protein SAMN04515647_4751 [Cohaesibacter sp. ES.047]
MKRTILLNGAIRDVEEFVLIADSILHKREQVDADISVVISTWHEDIAANTEIFRWLASEGAAIIGSPNIQEGGPANIYRQWRTLNAGLNACDDDALILKGRTDKFLLRKDVLSAFISREFNEEPYQRMISENRLAVEHLSLSLPFMAKDMIYLGGMKALRNVTHFSLRTRYVADHIFNGIGPECFLWLEYARSDSNLLRLVEKLDFRQISVHMLQYGSVFDYKFDEVPPHIGYLYKRWVETFDKEFLFLSDVLKCGFAPSWLVDEGSWRYLIGDRPEYEKLKNALKAIPPMIENPIPSTSYLNSASAHRFEDAEIVAPQYPFPLQIEQIRNSNKREYSDIVLLRQSIIKEEIEKDEPNEARLRKALYWNIRQRDRGTLEQSYLWLMEGKPQKRYMSTADQIFVLERMIDFFTFQQDFDNIGKTIDNFLPLIKKDPKLTVRLGEHYFRNDKKYKALYWFLRAYMHNKTDLGVAHGLGCTLLDLRFPKLAIYFLEKAHKISPNDQTAAFTLLRAYHATGKQQEAMKILDILSNNLRLEAERILNVRD